MHASITEIEAEIIEEFSLFDDQMDKYEYLIDIGKKLPALDAKYMSDDFLVKGCQSKVWLHAFEKEGRIFFEADSNTAITKGIIALPSKNCAYVFVGLSRCIWISNHSNLRW